MREIQPMSVSFAIGAPAEGLVNTCLGHKSNLPTIRMQLAALNSDSRPWRTLMCKLEQAAATPQARADLMRIAKWNIEEHYVHLAFQFSLWFKAIFALIEIGGGITAFFVSREFLVEMANLVTQGELIEDPHDLVANFILHTVQHLSINTQHFTAYYLLSHGAIKLWVIIGLLRERLWYYPTALIVFGLFILYQLYRFYFTHSPWLVLLTLVDLVVIALTWHEYKYLHRTLARKGIS